MSSVIPLENRSEVERVYGKNAPLTENNKPKESLIEWSMNRKKLEKYCDGYKGDTVTMKRMMDHFKSIKTYPTDYLGIAKKMAICKDPNSDLVEWWNAERCLSVENPEVGQVVRVTTNIGNETHEADWMFMGWADQPCHEFLTRDGNVMTLLQEIVDDLLPEDRQYLKMH